MLLWHFQKLKNQLSQEKSKAYFLLGHGAVEQRQNGKVISMRKGLLKKVLLIYE